MSAHLFVATLILVNRIYLEGRVRRFESDLKQLNLVIKRRTVEDFSVSENGIHESYQLAFHHVPFVDVATTIGNFTSTPNHRIQDNPHPEDSVTLYNTCLTCRLSHTWE